MDKDFIDLLTRLNAAYELLIKLGKQKKKALITIDMKTVAGLNDQEEKITSAITQMEKQRQAKLLGLIKADAHIRPDTTMAEMIRRAAPAQRETLTKLYDALTKNVAGARQLSEDNRVPVEAALRAVNYHLNRIGGTTVQPSYGKAGETGVQQHRRLNFEV